MQTMHGEDLLADLSLPRNFSAAAPATVDDIDILMQQIVAVCQQQSRVLNLTKAVMSERIREIEDAILVGHIAVSKTSGTAIMQQLANAAQGLGDASKKLQAASGSSSAAASSLQLQQNKFHRDPQQQGGGAAAAAAAAAANASRESSNNKTPDASRTKAAGGGNASSNQFVVTSSSSNDASGGAGGGAPQALDYNDLLDVAEADDKRQVQQQQLQGNKQYMTLSSSAAPSVAQLASRAAQSGSSNSNAADGGEGRQGGGGGIRGGSSSMLGGSRGGGGGGGHMSDSAPSPFSQSGHTPNHPGDAGGHGGGGHGPRGGVGQPHNMQQSNAGAANSGGGPPQFFVTVQFKRNRCLTYESALRVSPGQFVVVGGDRGEDIGSVVACWPIVEPPPPNAVAERATGGDNGAGTAVQRVATITEVAQLQGIQNELEHRACEVAQQKVMEHTLRMRIVDAEYQFDRKKLTFYYQAQSRLDFRVLVRDLFKTFRARIWMELDPQNPTGPLTS